ncbi:MAG: hypothetical protein UU92_C0007G0001, partial [candidate division WWE3 bacterium GW2011_GWA1_42_12]
AVISLLGEARRWGVDRWFATRKGEQNLAYSLPVLEVKHSRRLTKLNPTDPKPS